ncbi:hypothetical protein ACRSLK_07315 [Halopseudomonas pachastrellae]|uniref:hypothetical protein n=1 Tax=Halopseudomonas pachastrellae TaxID=254161 RepID=UPI003D7E9820
MTLNISKIYLIIALTSVPLGGSLTLLVASILYAAHDFKFSLGKTEKKIIALLLMIIVIAAAASTAIFSYSAAKDVFYLSAPIFYVAAGYKLYCAYKLKRNVFFKHLKIALMSAAILQITLILYGYTLSGISSYDLIRAEYGRGIAFISFFTGVLFGPKIKLLEKRAAFLSIGTALTALSLSRTSIFAFFLGLILSILFNQKISAIKTLKNTAVFLLLSSITFMLLMQNAWLQDKLLNTTTEMSVIDLNSADRQQIVRNWRAYETALTYQKFTSSDISVKFFGLGLGSSLTLSEEFNLSTGETLEEAGILHNAFAYIWMKSGLFGLLIYVYILLMLANLAIKQIAQTPNRYRALIIGSATFIIASSFIITGLYNHLQIPIFILSLICTSNMHRDTKLHHASQPTNQPN